MTDSPPPDISGMEPGNEYTVYYRSARSGNELDRTGTVTDVGEHDHPGRVVWLHEERRGCLDHAYLLVSEAETEDGEDCVACFSMTVSADTPTDDDPPKPGQVYTVRFESGRTTLLGMVDRVVREDGPGPMLLTDGGQPTLGAWGAEQSAPRVVREWPIYVEQSGEPRLVGFVGADHERDLRVYTSRRSQYHFYREGGGYAISLAALAKARQHDAKRILVHQRDRDRDVIEFSMRQYLDDREHVHEADLDDRSDPQVYVDVDEAMNRYAGRAGGLFVYEFEDACERIWTKRGCPDRD